MTVFAQTAGGGVRIPTAAELGKDLLKLSTWQRCRALALPLLFPVAILHFGDASRIIAVILAAAGYTFYSYGSTSHDLVHGNLGLPPGVNRLLLSLMEVLGLRSGHAYRAAHLHHHAQYPCDDDVEGAAAHGSFFDALLAGPFHQSRIWFWALRHAKKDRVWIICEGIGCGILIVSAIAITPISSVPLVYFLLVVLGSWTFPVITAYLPHVPQGKTPLDQTRRFRGPIVAVVFQNHLFHLEHHLYPSVPHQNWPELARRLDPFLDRVGIPAVTLVSKRSRCLSRKYTAGE